MASNTLSVEHSSNSRSSTPASLNRSQISLAHTRSVRSSHAGGTSKFRAVVTEPPWAREEPPSPAESDHMLTTPTHSTLQARPSTSATQEGDSTLTPTVSRQHAYEQKGGTSWWTFNRRPGQSSEERQGPDESQLDPQPTPATSPKLNWPILNAANAGKWARPFKERSLTWLSNAPNFLNEKRRSQENEKDARDDDFVRPNGSASSDHRERPEWNLTLPPPPREDEFTRPQSHTPGWQTPWAARTSLPTNSLASAAIRLQEGPGHLESDDEEKERSKWYVRRKRLRAFILNNSYVPLLFRIINIAFATASLVVAIQIRHKEMKNKIMGAVGSSPTLVIIFAPLTLFHVMIAVYLEYFGRPLGLWRTSMKLIHTLSDTFFVCAWSAALALCFDNYFTSVIGCAPISDSSWYNQLSRPVPDVANLGRGEGQPGDYICDHQVVLIALVFIGLIMYCSNLFISLFRIFEKVKYHPITHS